jgi:CheY-like chemotaxis protein
LEKNLLHKEGGHQYRKPSERAAGLFLSLIGWLKCIIGSTSCVVPPGRTIEHRGKDLPLDKTLRYPTILLVEDNPHAAESSLAVITKHYLYGSVIILIAHTYDAAVTFFNDEEVSLVIMDADLDDDDGDGADLTRRFLDRKPHLPILANSSSRISSRKLVNLGAVDTLGKSSKKLADWLCRHDPAGFGR